MSKEILTREKLHAYQLHCVEFMKEHPQALLILEMGLGKTIITLTCLLDLMFDRFEISKVLIVAPLRVARDVWPKECESWEHTRFLKMSVVIGSQKERMAALEKDADIYVINRENIKWLTEYFEKSMSPGRLICA